MAATQTFPKLSIIIPTINEASRLPLLLADLSLLYDKCELIISDAGSQDLTTLIGKLAGAKILFSNEANRGLQMKKAALEASGEWLLFIHADCRLTRNSGKVISKHIQTKTHKEYAWFFNFKVNKRGFIFRLLELSVFIRSNLFKRPYGDQGLLITKELYMAFGGYKELRIMEDLDLVLRISKEKKIKCLGVNLISDGRKWDKGQVIKNAFKNAKLRKRWSKGENHKSLAKEYYSSK